MELNGGEISWCQERALDVVDCLKLNRNCVKILVSFMLIEFDIGSRPVLLSSLNLRRSVVGIVRFLFDRRGGLLVFLVLLVDVALDQIGHIRVSEPHGLALRRVSPSGGRKDNTSTHAFNNEFII